ncbi:hypothetical protein [Streptomyces sp. NPDC059850]|uniref:hypothetical protein n=1 Tax=Streptomyces sp. NPDC059850 TaxID=3346970 RepID=UPI0036664DE4
MTDKPQDRDWARMRRADFDPSAPLDLVDARAVSRSVPAVAHMNGTEALFGEVPTPLHPTRTRRSAAPTTEGTDALF